MRAIGVAVTLDRERDATRDLSVSLMKLGDAQSELGSTEKAIDAYEGAAKILRGLVKEKPESDKIRQDLEFVRKRVRELQGEIKQRP